MGDGDGGGADRWRNSLTGSRLSRINCTHPPDLFFLVLSHLAFDRRKVQKKKVRRSAVSGVDAHVCPPSPCVRQRKRLSFSTVEKFGVTLPVALRPWPGTRGRSRRRKPPVPIPRARARKTTSGFLEASFFMHSKPWTGNGQRWPMKIRAWVRHDDEVLPPTTMSPSTTTSILSSCSRIALVDLATPELLRQ